MSRALPARAAALAVEAGREIGLETAEAAALRVTTSALIELPRAGAIARVEPPQRLAVARRQVFAARLLADRGVPAARLLAPDRQPIVLDGGIVTLWRRLEIVARDPGPEVLGRLARRLHEATAGDLPAATPALDPFADIRDCLERSVDMPLPPGAEDLWARLDRLQQRWRETISGVRPAEVFLHGDFHADNVVFTPRGPALLDLELAGRGPAAWDLVPQWLAVRRFGAAPADYERFSAAYGADVRAWTEAEVMCETYELLLAAWAVGYRDASPALAAEATLRLETLRGESDRPWTLQ